MRRRHYIVAAACGGLAGCTGILEGGETRDSDGDGVVDEHDYAPRDAAVQSKSDVAGGGADSADTDGDGAVDGQDYAPRDPDVQAAADLTTPPKVHSAGVLEVRQTFSADLDAGRESSGEGADFWFQAASETERYLSPREGATFALGESQPVGRIPDDVGPIRLREEDRAAS